MSVRSTTWRNTFPLTAGAGRGMPEALRSLFVFSRLGFGSRWRPRLQRATEARLRAVILSALAAAGDNGTGMLSEIGRQTGSEGLLKTMKSFEHGKSLLSFSYVTVIGR